MAAFTVSDPFTEVEHSSEPTGSLHILDEFGDSRIQWDKTDPTQVAAARARFDEFRAKGYGLAFKVDPSGKQDEIIDKFDPDAERIIMQKPYVGG